MLTHLPLALYFGALAALALVPLSDQGEVGQWILRSGATPQRLLAPAGLGLAMALVPHRLRFGAAIAAMIGAAAAVQWQVRILDALQGLPGAVSHDFLVLPISLLAIGLALAAGGMFRSLLILPAAAVVGAGHAIATVLSDTSFPRNGSILTAGLVMTACLAVAVALAVHSWPRTPVRIGARIVGSWFLAIGLLYLATAIMPPRQIPGEAPAGLAPPSAPLSGNDGFPDFGPPPDTPETQDHWFKP